MIIIKGKRIFLKILLVILLILVALAIWQRDNIKALYMGLTSSEDDLAQKRNENDKIITDTLEQYPELTVRDLTEEEKKLLAEGVLTKEEILLLLQGKLELEKDDPETSVPEVPEAPEEPDEPSVTDPPVTPEPEQPVTPEVPTVAPETPTVSTPSEIEPPVEDPPVSPPEEIETPEVAAPTVEEQISTLVAQMYVLKAEFTTALQNLENTTLKDYAALSEEEKTAELKSSMMTQVLDTVAAMEKDCDTKVNAVLASLTTLLKENDMSLTLVDSIRTAYNNEKTITKAEYINTYFK